MGAAESIESIFTEAIRLPAPAERAAFLANACGKDARLRGRVEALLKAHDAAGSFMASPADRSLDAVPATLDAAVCVDAVPFRRTPGNGREDAPAEQPGDHIGPYKLLQRIGEGGFGVVWMADQERPVRRRVALKIIKIGMDTREVIARFEQERQALAMMDHPNIARVLDAGSTRTGRPYFVMELVRGLKITDYCDDQGLSTTERIKLFITVCHAVQHAHQKGIIHRDLKPSNILVTINDGEAVPKIIDFGVAKATQGRLVDGTLFTQFEQMIGTPLYMSPEQAELTSLDVDTRSDIYSLGVLLYELLTGRTPIDTATMAKAGMDEVRRLIREVDPPRPSARIRTLAGNELTSVAKRRHTDPTRLPAALRGDIDWIVMKCLEKDRKRRYDTANGLGMDLQRHLHNEVVIARPPTTAYLLSKLMRRNKLAFAAGTAIAAALVIGIAASVWQAVRATSAEKRVTAALDELRASAPAFAEQARALAARERFDEAIDKLDYAQKLRPDVAEYALAKGDLLQCQFKLSEAAAAYRQALRLKPGLTRAEASAKLCEELLSAPLGNDGKPTRESLARLYSAMLEQQRPAAERMPVARRLGEENKLIVDYWLGRLKDLPVPADRPLKDRLTVREDGRLALDLSGTKVVDLSPLAGAPLAVLNVSGTVTPSELTDLAPLRGIDLIELNISRTAVTDLTPLREMHRLEKLEMAYSPAPDLAALGTLRLKYLGLTGCSVSDLSPIRRMPLEDIQLSRTRVADLAPLAGMPIKTIDLSLAPVVDFSPLAQLPLEKCYLQGNRITDLSVFRGRPLKELVLWGCTDARNYAVLSEIKTLELLMLPYQYRDLPADDYAAIGALRDHPRLRQLSADVMAGMSYAGTGPKDVFWQDWDREQAFVPALRKSGMKFSLLKLADAKYYLTIQNQPLRDLSILKSAPLTYLDVSGCPVSDLAPVHDLPLETLIIRSDSITDISPLHGMPSLKALLLSSSGVRDLSPLVGLPLKELYVDGCKGVTDLAVLAGITTLEDLTVPQQAANVDALRKLSKLQRLGYRYLPAGIPDTTATEFWKDYAWISRLTEAGIEPRTMTRLDDGTWNVNLENLQSPDLTPLRGAPIGILSLRGTPDLTPLRGMAIKKLWLTGTGITDLSPLKGMPLEVLSLSSNTTVGDISALRGMPLVELRMHQCAGITDLSPLADSKSLRLIVVPPNAKNVELLRSLPGLERISYKDDPKNSWRPDRTAAEFWKEHDANPWLARLGASGARAKTLGRHDDGTWEVDLSDTNFGDLAILAGAPISRLNLAGTAITDLTPLAGMPLTELYIDNTPVTDVSPLLRCPKLKTLLLPAAAKDVVALRALRGLERVSYNYGRDKGPVYAAAEFWLQLDRDRASAHVRAGRWAAGRQALAEAIRLHPDNHWNWFELAVLLARDGDAAAYRAHCHAMLDRFGTTPDPTLDPTVMERTAKSCLLLPTDDADRAAALRLAEAAATHEEDKLTWFRLTLGVARYRAGESAPAAAALARVNDGGYAPLGLPATAALARAQHRLGHTAEARALLKAAEARAAENLPKPGADPGEDWRDVFIARMLLREAREAIGRE